MVCVHFSQIRELKPSAFKLYIYLLHKAKEIRKDSFSMTLVDMGRESGLQSESGWQPPGKPYGNDGQLRNALSELVKKGYVEKTGGRGRKPNTYHLLKKPVAPKKQG